MRGKTLAITGLCTLAAGLVATNYNIASTSALDIERSPIFYVDLDNLTYSNYSKDNYEAIPSYDSLDSFLEAKNSNSLGTVYITNFLYDGVSSVKTPDLDDFVEAGSNDTKIKDLSIKVINVNGAGDYEFTGKVTGAMIGVDTNNKSGEINLILNNASLDTDSKKAPALYVYNKDKNYTDIKVTVKTLTGTNNSLEGGKLKKVSLIGSDELSDYSKYYSGDALTNYESYSKYYGIYTKEQIENVLFATVQADNEDLRDGDPYYFYKASGAVSSDIDLYFEGEGALKITSKNKEGVETKGNLTFNGGTGDYEIYAQDDCLNTTTASGTSGGSEVHNDMTINVKSMLAKVSEDADEGDAIDSNGKLTINGGTIIAIAHPSSPDAGLDSGKGTYINGGTIIATGNMTDAIESDSKQKHLYATFNQKIDADTLIVIKNTNEKVLAAFKTDRSISNLLYSSAIYDGEDCKIYTGGEIDGEVKNGLYTTINSYSGGTEISYSQAKGFGGMGKFPGEIAGVNKQNKTNVYLIVLISEVVVLVLVLLGVAVFKNRKKEE